jgi:hypothetical protein
MLLQELRLDLNEATRRQIEAEEWLSNEGDAFGDGMMTEAEMAYLTAMEEVKTISKTLVEAEQAFTLVRDRIQQLVSKYEILLAKIETESSISDYESSFVSEYQDSEFLDELEAKDKAVWARRAQRAEVKAELAAREAILARQEARMIKEEKERELEALHQKLHELQSESSHYAVDREHSATLANNFSSRQQQQPPHHHQQQQQKTTGSVVSENTGRMDKNKIDEVKKRFRDRIAAKKQQPTHNCNAPAANRYTPAVTPSPQPNFRSFFRSAGEEMHQQLDFYERSLRAVENDR